MARKDESLLNLLTRLPWQVSVLVILVAGLVSVGKSWQRRRLLNRQTGLDSVGKLSWQDFEALVGEAFRRKGYRVLENPGAGPDGGVDLRLRKDGKKVFVHEFGGHHTELSTTEKRWDQKNAWHEWQKLLHPAFPIM